MDSLLESQFLTLSVAGERYALPVNLVREVLRPTKLTKLPSAEPYLRGIIDIRGSGIPVVDLRVRFGFPAREDTEDTAIVVVENPSPDGERTAGLLTDAVHEVVQLDRTTLEDAPTIGSGISSDFIDKLGRQDGSFVFILKLDRVLETGDDFDDAATR